MEEQNDHGAGLIHQVAAELAETEPRPTFWMDDESNTGRKVVVESLRSRIRQMRMAADKARSAYKGEYMRTPLGYFADAMEDAARVLANRLGAIEERSGTSTRSANSGIV